MKPLTREWAEKAEGDFATARREWRVHKAPNYDAVRYHAQQGAEKYLKACLQEADMAFGKTHNLPCTLRTVVARRSRTGYLTCTSTSLNCIRGGCPLSWRVS